jgi:hypothetical protein
MELVMVLAQLDTLNLQEHALLAIQLAPHAQELPLLIAILVLVAATSLLDSAY